MSVVRFQLSNHILIGIFFVLSILFGFEPKAFGHPQKASKQKIRSSRLHMMYSPKPDLLGVLSLENGKGLLQKYLSPGEIINLSGVSKEFRRSFKDEAQIEVDARKKTSKHNIEILDSLRKDQSTESTDPKSTESPKVPSLVNQSLKTLRETADLESFHIPSDVYELIVQVGSDKDKLAFLNSEVINSMIDKKQKNPGKLVQLDQLKRLEPKILN